jgi:hypothetical protein
VNARWNVNKDRIWIAPTMLSRCDNLYTEKADSRQSRHECQKERILVAWLIRFLLFFFGVVGGLFLQHWLAVVEFTSWGRIENRKTTITYTCIDSKARYNRNIFL